MKPGVHRVRSCETARLEGGSPARALPGGLYLAVSKRGESLLGPQAKQRAEKGVYLTFM